MNVCAPQCILASTVVKQVCIECLYIMLLNLYILIYGGYLHKLFVPFVQLTALDLLQSRILLAHQKI